MPDRVYEPIKTGPKKGNSLSRKDFKEAKDLYYNLRDWDNTTGRPSLDKLAELDLEWLIELL